MMKRLLVLLLTVGVLSACDFDEPEINGMSNFKLGKLEGKTVDLSFDAKILNDNTYAIKVTSGKLNVTVNGMDLGVIDLKDNVKLKKKTEQNYRVNLNVTLANGALLKLPKLALANSYELKLEGVTRASVMGFGKKFDVKETRKISKDNLNLKELIDGMK